MCVCGQCVWVGSVCLFGGEGTGTLRANVRGKAGASEGVQRVHAVYARENGNFIFISLKF